MATNLTYTVKVANANETKLYAWAAFAIAKDASNYADAIAMQYPTWNVKVMRREYGEDVVDYIPRIV